MRLIDADALIEAMKKTESEYENAMTCPSWWSAFNVISEQPTAYSVEKVVKELEKELSLADKEKERCTGKNHLQFDSAKGYASGISTAIEIVKQGGKERI